MRIEEVKQADKAYMAIGKFVVKYERLIHAMRLTVGDMLNAGGLQNHPLGNIVTAKLNAKPLWDVLAAMISESSDKLGDCREIVTVLNKLIVDVTEYRNIIVHTTWFDENIKEKDNQIFGHKPSFNLQGVNVDKSKDYSFDDIKKYTNQCELLSQALYMFIASTAINKNVTDLINIATQTSHNGKKKKIKILQFNYDGQQKWLHDI